MTRAALLLIALSACANTYGSARTLDAGRTEVSVALTYAELRDQTMPSDSMAGDIQVHRGIVDRVEVGGRLMRAPGVGSTAAYFQLDGKVALVRDSRLAIAGAFALGGGWGEPSAGKFDNGRLVLSPSVFVGYQLTAALELVASPKLFVVYAKETVLDFGASLGLRMGPPGRTWAVHPEVGFVRLTEGTDDDTLLTFGIAVAASR